MWESFRARLGESSTYVGLALLMQGADKLLDKPVTAPFVDGVVTVGRAVETNDPMAIAMSIVGLGMMVFKQSKFR